MKDLSGPDCLIVDGDYFLGFPLCQFLLRKGCRVAWASRLTSREKKSLKSLSDQISFGEKIPQDLSLFQYLFFFFNDNQKKLEAITKVVKDKSIKLIVVVAEETAKINFAQYKNINLRVVRFSDV